MARDTAMLDADETMTTTPSYMTLDNVTVAVPDVTGDADVLTIVGQGAPLSFEIAAHGSVELLGADPREEAVVISDGVAEGAISTGYMQFVVHGDLGDVTFLRGTGEAYLGDTELDVDE